MNSSFSNIKSEIRENIALGRIDSALRIAFNFVERIITEPLCTSRVFASRDLDMLCQEIGRVNLKREILSTNNPVAVKIGSKRLVYVVSRLQNCGGHLRTILEMIAAQPTKEHLILATNVVGVSDVAFLSNYFSKHDNVFIAHAPQGTFASRLTWLQRALLEANVDHVYLFHHHQDSVAVAAFVPELNLQGSFCHHGDHHLCLGVHLSHVRHLDFHPMAYHYCREELGVDNIYVPLVCADQGGIDSNEAFSHEGCLTTATVARSNKLDPRYYVRYAELVPRILECTKGRHIHIGKLTRLALSKIKAGMIRRRISINRFVYVEWTPSVWRMLVQYKVDLYLSSFPLGAGLTLIEAMGAGVPVVMHEHIFSRVHSSLELAYPQAYRWSDPEKLLEYLSHITPEQIRKERGWARSQYKSFHQPKYLASFLEDGNSTQRQEIPALISDFRPKLDEWAAWAEAQLSVSHLLYRWAHRMWRSLRARFQWHS